MISRTATSVLQSSEDVIGTVAAEEKLASPLQVRLLLTGAIDCAQFRAIWQSIAAQHTQPVNGSHVNGNGNGSGNGNGKEHASPRLPWQEHDLRGLSPDEARDWMSSFLETDANQKISAQRGPGMRFALAQTDEDVCELVWSLHPALSKRIDPDRTIEHFIEACGAGTEVEQIFTPPKNGTGPRDGGSARKEFMAEVRSTATSAGAVVETEAKDEIEERLTEVWEKVLNVSGISVDGDFFDRGGHSLLAARLLGTIEDALGIELPLASLLEAPTIRGQAKLIREYSSKQTNPLRAPEQQLRDERVVKQLPFFLLGGDPTFRPLAQRLSELRELHNLGLQSSVVSKLTDPYSLECMAEHLVAAIRERRPQGPYMLAGWCAHGLLAYETARQLQEQGQEVAVLIMLESVQPVKRAQYSGWKRLIARTQLKIHLLKFEYAYMKQLNGSQARDYVAGRAVQKLARVKDSFRQALKITNPEGNGDGAGAGNPVDVLYTAAGRYHPKPYDGKVVLVRSLQRTYGFGRQLDLGWGDTLGSNLEICESPGNHYTLYMHPNVDALALKINVCLRRAEERAARSESVAASR